MTSKDKKTQSTDSQQEPRHKFHEKSNRRKSRELLLQALFQRDYIPQKNLKESLKKLRGLFTIDPEVYQYAEKVATLYDEHSSKIDLSMASLSRNWSLNRMSHVDRNILRLALVEIQLLPEEIPPKVAINEAVEIAKEYGTEDSGSFVNGLLDQALKDLISHD